jgi:undecaprenyl diphosphate synthase
MEKQKILSAHLPRHIAVIMDGNGRWATRHHLPRFRGHLEGVRRVEEIVAEANKLGIEVLTLFTFSTENWCRPSQEIGMLMNTLCSVLDKKAKKLMKGNIKLRCLGRRGEVPQRVLKTLDHVSKLTKNNTGMILNLAFNYGSRLEIVDAVKKIALAAQKGQLNIDEIDEELFSQALYTKGLPDPDLLLRTSGERRLSNFLLWQLSYAEFYFSEKFWPDFGKKEFREAILDYQKRERRYGHIKAFQEASSLR